MVQRRYFTGLVRSYSCIKHVLSLLTLLLLPIHSMGHETTATKADIALEEKLGQYIPADARLH